MPEASYCRPATESDIPAITAIFNHAIHHNTASFYYEPRTEEQRRDWLVNRPARYAVLVAETAGTVSGWAALDTWSLKEGYRITTEASWYVQPEFQGRGVGTLLVDCLIQAARQNRFRSILAKICENNLVSMKVADRFGFQRIGTLKSVGEKFDRLFDVHMYQKLL